MLQKWPGDTEHWQVQTGQGTTFVVASGPKDAPALIALHGSAGNAAMWMYDAPVWAERFRVYAVDLIGEPGYSAPARPGFRSRAYREWLQEVLAGLKVKTAAIVAVSLGTWIAVDFASAYPEKVWALALLSPAGIGRQRWSFPLAVAALLSLGDWGRRKLRRMVMGRRPLSEMSPKAREFMEFILLAQDHYRPRTLVMPRFTDEQLSRLTMPLLAVLGGKDVMVNAPDSKGRLERLTPHAEIQYHAQMGHFLPRQNQQVLEFLDRALHSGVPGLH
jgi:pimeloyl-ACP methyl ester carboxylesterase